MKNAPLPSKNISNRPHYCNMIRYLFQSVVFLPQYIFLESAKLRILRAENVLTCERVLRAYVPMRQRALRAYVLTCQRALRAYVLTCQRALRAYLLICQRALRAHVPTC